ASDVVEKVAKPMMKYRSQVVGKQVKPNRVKPRKSGQTLPEPAGSALLCNEPFENLADYDWSAETEEAKEVFQDEFVFKVMRGEAPNPEAERVEAAVADFKARCGL